MSEPQRHKTSKHPLLNSILDDFLEWTSKNRATATYESYQARLQRLVNYLSKDVTVNDLKPHVIQDWIDSNPSWAATTKRGHVIAVQRALSWAVKMGHIESSPIAHFEKPPAESRDQIVTRTEYERILEYIPDEEFRDLVTIHWESGCRPQESLRVEAKFVDRKNSRWVFPVKKSKGKRKPRIVYLNELALEITERRMKRWPEGPIFRNTKGTPWNVFSANCRFDRLKKKVGSKYCLYQFRHSFATRMLESGLDALTVALLLGHSNPAMLATTYQHLAHVPGHLLDQLKKATGEKDAA